MIQPVQRAELEHLRNAADSTSKDFKEHFGQARDSLKASTLAKATDQHPLAAVCVAAIGGCILSRFLGFRSLRFVALLAAEPFARKALAAIADKD